MFAKSASLRTLVRALLGVGVVLAAPCAYGLSTYDRTWDGLYSSSSSDENAGCALCHASASPTYSNPSLNAYGSAIRDASGASLTDRIKAVQALNSDRDPTGATNLVEIQANSQPGWTGSAVYGVVGDLDPVTSVPDEPAPDVALPDISVSPTALSFGAVDVGVTATLKTTITNKGGAELEVTDLGFTQVTSADFELNTVPETPFTIPAYGYRSITVGYTPSAAGGDSGALEIESDSPGEELVTVSLAGTGVVPAVGECAISVTQLELDFGSVEVDTVKTLYTKVINAGSVDCEVDAEVSSTDGTFALVSDDSLTVKPGSSAYVKVAYQPVYLGDDAGALDLSSNDPDKASIAVPLSGTGVAAEEEADEDAADTVDDALPDVTVSADLDLDIGKLAVRRRAWLSAGKPLTIMLMVQNAGVVDGEAQATLTGVQNGVEVYNESRLVTDAFGRGRTKNLFPAYTPTAAGEITWTATIDDGDPDEDVATTTTRIMNR